MSVCFVDTETTGLDPERHAIYEVGLITPNGNEHHWWLPVDRLRADEVALRIGYFHERHPLGNARPAGVRTLKGSDDQGLSEPKWFAEWFARLTHGHHLAGAVISFDAERLARLLRSQGFVPSWHYHIIDVEALAAGYIVGQESIARTTGDHGDPGPSSDELRTALSLPWDSQALSNALGIDPDRFERHTALGDARWAKAIYDAVMGRA